MGAKKEGRMMKSKGFEWTGSKKFDWRQINHCLLGGLFPIDGGTMCEVQISGQAMVRTGYVQWNKSCILPPASHVSLVCGIINQALPEPQGARRGGKQDNWHIEINEVIFPSALVIDDGKKVF